MLFKILAAFDYSPDGLTVVPLTAESPPMPIRADICDGLVEAKLIEEVKPTRQARASA